MSNQSDPANPHPSRRPRHLSAVPPHAPIEHAEGSVLEVAIAEGDWIGDAVRRLAQHVGGLDALQTLGTDPLPDEPFDWSAVEDQDREYVAEVLQLTDSCCDAMLDVEYRTIARRILALVAARDPRPFRRGGRTQTCAAGLVWLVLRANQAVGRGTKRRAGWIWSWFRVSSSTDRGYGLRNAAGLLPPDIGVTAPWSDDLPLGTATLLHSRVRHEIARQRTRYEELAVEHIAQRDARRPMTAGGDGQLDVRARPASPLFAAKGIGPEGRAMITVGLGESDDDAEFFAVSIPDTHTLVAMLERALAMPLPRVQG